MEITDEITNNAQSIDVPIDVLEESWDWYNSIVTEHDPTQFATGDQTTINNWTISVELFNNSREDGIGFKQSDSELPVLIYSSTLQSIVTEE